MSSIDTTANQRQRKWAWVWLGYTGFLFIQPLMEPSLRLWLGTLAAFAVFLGIFALYVRASRMQQAARYWTIAATFALGLATFPWNQGASTFFVYAAAFLPFSIQSIRKVLLLFLLECLIIVGEGYLFDFAAPHGFFHIGLPNTLIAVFLVLVIGGGNIFFAEQTRADQKLRLAQEENIALAAVAERERIARDLHDVLGHTLSVIVLKAELAGRLLTNASPRDPERLSDSNLTRAAREIADVERTARTALAEVREAIGGYRAKGLAAELELARNTLASAGVALSCESPIPRLNAAEETVLALALREAVTNIVRHARAQHCRMTFETTPDGFHSLTVEDDGAGIGTGIGAANAPEGNGLRGMRERVHSLGGRVSISSGRAISEARAISSGPTARSPGTILLIELPAAPAVFAACVNA